jgi:hypothetical protein
MVICWEQSCGLAFVPDETSELTAVQSWTPSNAPVTVAGNLHCVTLPLVGNNLGAPAMTWSEARFCRTSSSKAVKAYEGLPRLEPRGRACF